MSRGSLAVLGALAVTVGCRGPGNDKTAHESTATPIAQRPAPPPPDAAIARQAAEARPAAHPSTRSEHVAFRLVENRHAMHRFSDGELVLDGGDIGFARYIRFGMPAPRWKLGVEVDGTRAAVADRLATLEVPLSVDQAKRITFVTARVHGSAKQRLALKVNGRKPGKDASVELVDGWITVAIPIAPGYFGPGENQVVLETAGGKSNIAFEWIRFGTSISNRDPRDDAKLDPATDSITLGLRGAVVWYLTIPDGANLVASVEAPCKVEVRASADDRFVGGLLGGDTSRLDLGSIAGRAVALSLSVRDCKKAVIKSPRITLHGPEPATLARAEPPKFIILWVMDALRADRVPVFTPGARALVPNLAELAKTSTTFRDYYVQGNESQTSHSSMFTGLYPAVHNVRLAGVGGVWRIDPKFAVLAQQLATAGYTTLGVTGNGYVNDEGGYSRGFDDFRNMMRETGVDSGIIFGQKIVDAALQKLDKHREEATFLFLGTIDTHGPWIARKPWIDTYSPKYKGPFEEATWPKDIGLVGMGCTLVPPADDVERIRAIYDSDISYQDMQLGRLVAQLQSWGIWDQTMLIITADHGDELFEDKRCGHGQSLRDAVVRVPLMIHDPARFPGDTVVDEGAECVDLLPTILDAASVGQVDVQGAPLEALAQGVGKGWPRPAYASQYEYAHAMRIGRWKMRVGWSGTPIVNDMAGDPGEMTDVAAQKPIERRMLTDNLGMFLALRDQWKKASWGVVTNVTAAGAKALDGATVK